MKKIIKFPTHAKPKKGTNWFEDGYKVWCFIKEINLVSTEMSLVHPKLGEFAWVDIEDCDFKISEEPTYLCDHCESEIVTEKGDLCEECKI